MSAFIVGNEVINAFLSFACNPDAHAATVIRSILLAETGCDLNATRGDSAMADKLGQAMRILNARAVDARYPDHGGTMTPDGPYKYSPMKTTAIRALKCLQCWLYQCSEGDVPDTSLLFNTMERIADKLALVIVSESPEYKAESWG